MAGLDPNVTEEMYGLIEELNKQGLTIIMISHDLDNVKKYASKIYDVNSIEGVKESAESSANKEVGVC